jgi:hypothetical protein
MTPANPFPADALDANRSGGLTDAQRRNLGALAGYNRRNAFTTAAFLVAGAMIVLFLARADAPVLVRFGTAGGALAIAAFLVLRSVTGADALTRDLEDTRVHSTEGAIGKRRVSGGRTRSSYYLDVGDQAFRIGRDTYEWLPEAGRVRLYFLPHSRKVVNIDVLPNPAATTDLKDIATKLGTAVFASRLEANEARAEIAGVADAFNATFNRSPQPPPADTRDPRPLAEAIVGTWTNGVIRATFSADGTLVVRMLVSERKGRWSVDGAGRLRADITGAEQSADAWIAGDRLTIALEGAGLTLTREAR